MDDRQDENLQHELERSKQVGRRLLEKEQDELEAVSHYAEELLSREYRC